MTTIEVAELWRFPVKSMGGHRIDEVRVDGRGVRADRLWALRDLENGVTASARRMPALLGCSARYEAEPADDAGPGNVPSVVVTFPDGDECSSSDAEVHRRLSELVGRDVRLTALPPVDDTSQHRLAARQAKANFSVTQLRSDFGLSESDAMPDTSVFTPKQLMTLARFSTPPGTFVDLSPVHLLTTTSLRSLSADGAGYDVRRFRPNVLLDVLFDVGDPESAFPEADWVGGTVVIGSAELQVTIPTIRCVVPTRPQPGVELDRQVSRQLAERTDRFLGIYADVSTPGRLRVGDRVHVRKPAEPSAVHRTATAAARRASRGVQRLLEATVLRGKA
jgi:uncharacterized protein YcbX